ncbi:MAG: flagellar hook-associated protein FlgL [Methylophilaceae bacterium]|jgi:flagellar hook-associated protein 3 FlgL|nr:flagellar hook-associated protein FlgL [Methyloradius sp.]
MRISTNTIYNNGISKINDLTSDQSKLLEQISTMKRVLKPSDDPVAAARALQVKQAQTLNTQYANNRSAITSNLENVDTTLNSISDILISTQSTIISAGDAAYSDSQRADLAKQIRSSIGQLVGVANSKDASGNYIFAGYQTNTKPYTETATGATYAGDSGQANIQVSAERTMPANYAGSQIFNANGVDVFATMSNLATLLETPVTTQAARDALTAGLASANSALGTSLDGMLAVRSQVGSNLSELDSLNTAGTDIATQYASTLSGLQDLDYAQAVTDLTKNKTVLEAAQQSFVQVTNLSLFNYLK